MTAKFSQAVSTSVFRGVSDADCLRQAEVESAEARSLGYEPLSQSWADDAGLRVLTVVYRYSGRPAFGPTGTATPVETKSTGLPLIVRLVLGVGGIVLLITAITSFYRPNSSGVPGPFSDSRTLTGSFTLTGDYTGTGGANPTCEGDGGYSDVKPGMAVTVKNQAGTIIATGDTVYDHQGSGECGLKFTIAALPDATFYSIEVGRRGSLAFSRDELAARGWHVDFTLGT